MKKDLNNRLPDWDAPETLYCELCGKKMDGDEIDLSLCSVCNEHVDGVMFNDIEPVVINKKLYSVFQGICDSFLRLNQTKEIEENE